MEGSSLDPARETKEQMARAAALKEQERQRDLENNKRYELVNTPSPEPVEEKKRSKKRKSKNRYLDDYILLFKHYANGVSVGFMYKQQKCEGRYERLYILNLKPLV